MINKLKPKEQLFCYYYAQLRNCKEAAIKAGFGTLIAEFQGDRLLQRSDIAQAIKKISQQKEYDELLQSVIAGLNRLAFANTNDSVKLILKNREDLEQTIDTLDLFHIAEIKIPKENAIEIKFFDRFKAFDKLIELINTQTGKQDANEFYKALEARANILSQDGERKDF